MFAYIIIYGDAVGHIFAKPIATAILKGTARQSYLLVPGLILMKISYQNENSAASKF